MFENISKGTAELHKYSKTTVQLTNGRTIAACAGYSTNTDNGEHVSENEENAKFFQFCFNLQQRYDISKLEEVVRLLDGISFVFNNEDKKDIDFGVIQSRIEQLLKQIKK